MCQGKTSAAEIEADSKGLLALHQSVKIKRKKLFDMSAWILLAVALLHTKIRGSCVRGQTQILLLCATLSVFNKQLRLNASMHFHHFTSFLRLLKEPDMQGEEGGELFPFIAINMPNLTRCVSRRARA